MIDAYVKKSTIYFLGIKLEIRHIIKLQTKLNRDELNDSSLSNFEFVLIAANNETAIKKSTIVIPINIFLEFVFLHSSLIRSPIFAPNSEIHTKNNSPLAIASLNALLQVIPPSVEPLIIISVTTIGIIVNINPKNIQY